MKELNAEKQQYGGQSQPSAPNIANQYFPEANGQGRVPVGYQPGTNLSAGTTTTPSGDTLPLHNWATDRTDYSQQMLNAKSWAEFAYAAQQRVNKAEAQGIDIMSGAGGTRTNEQIYEEWLKKSGHDPKLSSFVTPGIGHDSITGKEGWIDNAGTAQGRLSNAIRLYLAPTGLLFRGRGRR